MFTVEGYTDQDGIPVSYAVEVGHPDEETIGYRITAGSPTALAVLQVRDGRPVSTSPTGDVVTADAGTPEGVLAILHEYTEVTAVEGEDVPELPPVHGTHHE